MKIIVLFLVFIIISVVTVMADNHTLVITGKVLDAGTNQPVPGASIQELNTTRGVYSSSRGDFRLPLINSPAKIRIRSIGYEEKTLTITESSDNYKIELTQKPVSLAEATAIGEIDANNVIKRAIEKKQDNMKQIETFSGLLYSKMVLEMDGSVFNSFIPDGPDDTQKAIIMETFSNNFIDIKNNRSHTEIIQRRQTANIPADQNLLSLGQFMSFYVDKMTIIDATFTTPLANDAFSVYDYELIERQIYGEHYVYVIRVIPKTRLLPAFEGTIKILEESYHLIEIDLKPSKNTAISFITDMHIIQKLEEVGNKLWYPTFLELTGQVAVEVIKGLADIRVDLNSTSIYSDIMVNIPIPDTLFKDEQRRITKVAAAADSSDLTFWENNSLREITPKEIEVYNRIDSLVAEKVETEEGRKKSVSFSIMPYIDFNRATSVSLGAIPEISFWRFNLRTPAYFSFGLQKILGEVQLETNLYRKGSKSFNLTASVFSREETFSMDRQFLRLLNTLGAAFTHIDYYDYYFREGYRIGLESRISSIYNNTSITIANHTSLKTTTERSILYKKKWREQPQADEGRYMMIKSEFSNFNTNQNTLTIGNTGSKFKFAIEPFYGKNVKTDLEFYGLHGFVNQSFNLINTGYGYINNDFQINAGWADGEIPVQYQYRMTTNTPYGFISKLGNFYSAPISEYGGKEFISGHYKINLGDIWWRFLHLPTYYGRGIDLSLEVSSGKYNMKGLNNDYYSDTRGQFYSEAGVGFSKIPTFVSNVIFLGFDARWGFGPVAKGNFGWSLSLKTPF
jgi:hypothetical protein